ncbi:MAG: hypothetical protein ACREUG_02900 [Steroidobacteraceae bacterium]
MSALADTFYWNFSALRASFDLRNNESGMLTVQTRRALQAWPRVVLPEVGFVVSRWTAARAGAIASLWPSAPRWLGGTARAAPGRAHHFTSGGRLMR